MHKSHSENFIPGITHSDITLSTISYPARLKGKAGAIKKQTNYLDRHLFSVFEGFILKVG